MKCDTHHCEGSISKNVIEFNAIARNRKMMILNFFLISKRHDFTLEINVLAKLFNAINFSNKI